MRLSTLTFSSLALLVGCSAMTKEVVGRHIDDGSTAEPDTWTMTWPVQIETNQDSQRGLGIALYDNGVFLGYSPLEDVELDEGQHEFSAEGVGLRCHSIQTEILDSTSVHLACNELWAGRVPRARYQYCNLACSQSDKRCRSDRLVTIWSQGGMIRTPRGELSYTQGYIFATEPGLEKAIRKIPIGYVDLGAEQIAYWGNYNPRRPDKKPTYFCRVSAPDNVP